MVNLTVKDFILYNGPCRFCKNPVNIIFSILNKNHQLHGEINLSVNEIFSQCNLKINYQNSLILSIINKTNEFKVNDEESFKDFLHLHELALTNSCKKCKCVIISNNLEFDVKKKRISPITLEYESLYLSGKDIDYHLDTQFKNTYTSITIHNKITKIFENLNIPQSPLNSFKNKEELINKIKTYLVFS